MGQYAPFSSVTRDALGYACEVLGLPLDAGRTETLMEEYRKLAMYPDVSTVLETLGQHGRRLAILTNGSPDMIEPLVAHHGLGQVFTAVLSADELRFYKPSPRIYARAVQRLEAPADAIGFVSSNSWDAAGAKAFGFRVFWINRHGAPVERLGFPPDGVLRTLGDLPELL